MMMMTAVVTMVAMMTMRANRGESRRFGHGDGCFQHNLGIGRAKGHAEKGNAESEN